MLILLVEDEMILAMMLEMSLTQAGHHVLGPVETMSAGLTIAELRRPDLALVNINLKDGSSGVDLARELLTRWNIHSLFVSGQAAVARRHADAALGFIDKPYTPETVLEGIQLVPRILDGYMPSSAEIPRGLELFPKQALQ